MSDQFSGEVWDPPDFPQPVVIEGPRGPRGDKGDPGAQGPRGFDGPTGPTGPPGLSGARGTQGPQGERGVAGLQGVQGIQGPKGNKGDKGDTGDQGIPGSVGLKLEETFIASPLQVWLINHTIPFSKPSVLAFDAADRPIWGDVTYPSDTSVRIAWAWPLAGRVVLTT